MKRPPVTDVVKLKAKFQEAMDTGRSQSALRLARDIAHAEPKIDHRDMLRKAVRLRAEHLQRENQLSESAVLWRNLLTLGETPGTRELVAENLARCGFAAEATGLLASLPADAPARQRALASVADGAIEKGPAGKALLPAEHHAGFDAVLQAIEHAHQGRDNEARAAMQVIGLQSPFLEWKVFVRGLLAWYAGDDPRALETWVRLQPSRLPWRLAAPLRFGIDAEFRQTQSPSAQAALQKAADRATGSRDLELVRGLQSSLQHAKRFSDVFRVADSVIKYWRTTRPELIEPLRRTLAAAIIQRGDPADLRTLANHFGHDFGGPEYRRLLAVGGDKHGLVGPTILSWTQYLEQSALNNTFGIHQTLADAMVWERMGTLSLELDALNFDDMDDENEWDDLPTFEDCFAQSIKLAPHRRKPYMLRFAAFAADPELKKEAIAAGEALIERFPDDPSTLERLGDMYRTSNSPSKAFNAYERALAQDPLNRKLRHRLGVLSLHRVIAGNRTKLATLRADLAKVEELTPELAPFVYARRHFLEATKGDAAVAEEAKQKLVALPNVRFASPFLIALEAERYGAPPAQIKNFGTMIRAQSKTGGTPEEYVLLAEMMKVAALQDPGKTPMQAGWHLCKAAKFESWTERHVERFMLALSDVPQISGFLAVVRKAEKRFPKNPFLMLAEFASQIRERVNSPWVLRDLAMRMEEQMNELPRERQADFAEQLAERGLSLESLRRMGNPRSFLDSIFDSF